MALPFAQIQSAGNSVAASAGTTMTVTLPNPTKEGNLIVLVIGTSVGATSVVSSVSDSNGNTYTSTTTNVNTIQGEVWAAKGIIGGSTPVITIHFSASGVDFVALAVEYRGVNRTSHFVGTANPYDVRKTNTGNSASITSGNSSATNQNTELIIMCGVVQSSTGGFSLGAGYGNLVTQSGGTASISCALEDKTVTTQGIQSGTMTCTSGLWVGILAGFVGNNNAILPGNHLRPHPFSPGLAR